jgi:hypothetical protein
MMSVNNHEVKIDRRSLSQSILSSFFVLACLALIHYPMWSKGYTLGWDSMRESWGDLSYTINALSDGFFPFWNHLERGGYPFLADPQTAILYPLHWPLYLLGWLLGNGPWLAVGRAIIHYFVAALGCHILALSYRASHALSLLFALSYTLSGRLLKSKDNAGLWTMVWLPWLMWSTHQLILRPTYRKSLILAGVTTLAFYAGYPPNLARSFVFLSIWIIYQLYLTTKKLSKDLRISYLTNVGKWISLSGGITILLCSPGMISTIQVLKDSERSQLGLGQLLASRFQLVDTLDLIVPRAIHSNSYSLIYIGLASLVLLLSYLQSNKSLIHERIFWIMMSFMTLLWTCGGNTPFLRFFIEYIPTFNLWRIAEQYAFLLVFTLVFMSLKAGINVEIAIANHDRRPLFKLALFASSISTFITILFFINTLSNKEIFHLSYSSLVVSLLLTIILWILVKRSQSTSTHLWVCLVIITVIDIGLTQQPLVEISQPIPKASRDSLVQLNHPYTRFADHEYLGWRPASRVGKADLIGRYSTMVGKRWRRYSQASKKHNNLYAWGSVDQVFSRRHRPKYIKESAPYAYWTNDYRYQKSPHKVLRSLELHQPKDGLIAFGDTDSFSKKSELISLKNNHEAPPFVVKVQQAQWGLIKLSVHAPSHGILVVNESYSPWWQAQIDHQPWIRTHRLNYLFQGIPLPAGQHEVTFCYRETYTIIALWIALCTLLLIGLSILPKLSQRQAST